MSSALITDQSTHFEFGKNWEDYARQITPERIERAKASLMEIIGANDLRGKTFLDIGSGSGLHALCALQLGAERVVAIDFDPDSVATTRNVLDRFWDKDNWSAERISVFDATPDKMGTFDIVYSWGVLHHTGGMYEAIRRAAALVKPGGELALALYGKTLFCGAWRVEKWFYTNGPEWARAALRTAFEGWYRVGLMVCYGPRYSMKAHKVQYLENRGMTFENDVHDWLGGYPYESISPSAATKFLSQMGFQKVWEKLRPGIRTGIFGTGCDEYRFVRSTPR